jgi:hypothetical protein
MARRPVGRKPSRGPTKPNAGQFKPGVSGNPSGAKKIDPDIRKAFSEISPFAVQKLFELLNCGQRPVELGAAREILDRDLGRSRQAVEVSGPDRGAIVQHVTTSMTAEQAAQLYAKTLGIGYGPAEPEPPSNGQDHQAPDETPG